MSTTRRGGRRHDVVQAAHRCIARRGFERATTAEICAAAGVSSGTFFHYFPTKTAVLVAVLEEGLEHARAVFARIRATADDDAVLALAQWQAHISSEAADDDLAGFVAAMGSMPKDPGVSRALRAETELVQQVLTHVVAAGQRQGVIRNDTTPERVAVWLGIVADGLMAHVIEQDADAEDLRPDLNDVVTRLVRP